MKILIYGGSFNPIHIAHKTLLEQAIKQIKPDKTYIFVAYHSPYKDLPTTSYELRKEMAQKVLCPLSKDIVFDDFEFNEKRKVFTFETLAHLRKIFPKAEFYILVGADCLQDAPKWKRAEYNFKNATFVVASRQGVKMPKTNFPCIKLKGKLAKVSSTDLRLQLLLTGKLNKNILPEIAPIITKNQLYGFNYHCWLKSKLKAPRFNHILAVAREAVKLAEVYKQDKERSALAGLLHDAGKSMSKTEMAKYAKEHKIKAQDFDLICENAPALLHAEISAYIAENVFNIKDKAVLQAISFHTLGSNNMTDLDKILMIADMCAKGRRPQDIKKIKIALKKGLNQGLLVAQEVKLIYTITTHKWLSPRGIKLWNQSLLEKI